MIRHFSLHIFVIISFLFLSGCITHVENRSSLEAEIKTNKKYYLELEKLAPESSSISTIINNSQDTRDKKKLTRHERRYDWDSAIHSIINQMKQSNNFGGILLVDTINDCTNGSLNFKDAISTLRNAIEEIGVFTLISEKQLMITKNKLGILPQDKLNSPAKAIGIARDTGAHYVLYSNAIGNVDAIFLQIQLILVKTGEILWSGKIAVQEY